MKRTTVSILCSGRILSETAAAVWLYGCTYKHRLRPVQQKGKEHEKTTIGFYPYRIDNGYCGIGGVGSNSTTTLY